MIRKLTAFLIRRDPEYALKASVFFSAHDAVIQVANEDHQGLDQEVVANAGDRLAEKALDELWWQFNDYAPEMIDRVRRTSESTWNRLDDEGHELDCDARLSGDSNDCTCKPVRDA